jgi:UDPglucose 6-dehydrogenase
VRLTVIGLGYLGATHAVAMAKLGHQVIGIEQDQSKLESLRQGKIPFHEPGLDRALTEVLSTGRLTFQSDHDSQSSSAEIHFICVGTPQKESGEADTSYVFSAAKQLAKHLKPESVVAGKSTVPVGTAAKLRDQMSEIAGFPVHLAWNPEFLREGTALEDSLKPDRIVVGSWDQYSVEKLKEAYGPILKTGTPFLSLDVETAELVKVAANAFLATKISFINAMAEISEAAGADAVALAEAIGHDERIGKKFLRSGIGFGGGCLPKDIRGFIARAEELGVGSSLDFLKDVDQINLRRRSKVVELAKQELGTLANKKVLVLGISFKPDSDDLRDSPSLEIARRLSELGAEVVIHDPVALAALKEPGKLKPEQNLEVAAKDADLVILGTEWREYRELEPAKLRVKSKVIIDGRNVLDVKKWQLAGWKVIALGRNIQN